MMQVVNQKDNVVQEDMVRHMVLNSLRSYRTKFFKDYGELVICYDGRNYWRKEIFPYYKQNRKKSRESSNLDWDAIFGCLNDIKQELKDFFPYKHLEVYGAEADDIIATLVAQRTEDKYLIISGDKDFIQLQHYGDVYQFSPLLKSFIGEQEDATVFLREQIIKGDRSDGVPNILSDDDIFLRDERQKPINKKRLEEWSNVDNIPLGSETRKYYDRNKKLIDLSMIPKDISESIINRYKNYKVNDRSQLLQYFIDNKLKALIENINDF